MTEDDDSNILYVTVLMCGLTVIVYVIQRLTDSLVRNKEENQSYRRWKEGNQTGESKVIRLVVT